MLVHNGASFSEQTATTTTLVCATSPTEKVPADLHTYLSLPLELWFHALCMFLFVCNACLFNIVMRKWRLCMRYCVQVCPYSHDFYCSMESRIACYSQKILVNNWLCDATIWFGIGWKWVVDYTKGTLLSEKQQYMVPLENAHGWRTMLWGAFYNENQRCNADHAEGIPHRSHGGVISMEVRNLPKVHLVKVFRCVQCVLLVKPLKHLSNPTHNICSVLLFHGTEMHLEKSLQQTQGHVHRCTAQRYYAMHSAYPVNVPQPALWIYLCASNPRCCTGGGGSWPGIARPRWCPDVHRGARWAHPPRTYCGHQSPDPLCHGHSHVFQYNNVHTAGNISVAVPRYVRDILCSRAIGVEHKTQVKRRGTSVQGAR